MPIPVDYWLDYNRILQYCKRVKVCGGGGGGGEGVRGSMLLFEFLTWLRRVSWCKSCGTAGSWVAASFHCCSECHLTFPRLYNQAEPSWAMTPENGGGYFWRIIIQYRLMCNFADLSWHDTEFPNFHVSEYYIFRIKVAAAADTEPLHKCTWKPGVSN